MIHRVPLIVTPRDVGPHRFVGVGPGGGGGGPRIVRPATATPAAGGAVTLTGSGFGTKATAAPLGFSNFESAALGQTTLESSAPCAVLDTASASIGFESLQNGANLPSVTDSTAHSGAQCLVINCGASDVPFPNIGVRGFPAGCLDHYQSQWTYFHYNNAQVIRVWKWGRAGAMAGGGYYYGNPNYYLDFGYINAAAYITDNTGGTLGVNEFQANPNPQPSEDGWHFIETWYRLSTPGVADGLFVIKVDGVTSVNFTNVATRDAGITDPIAWAISAYDGMDNTNGADVDFYLDELYMDSTFSRVVATDNGTYGSSTKWAAQPVSSWSNTEIVISSPNWSDLVSGSTAYFHVFDADDAHVDSFARTVP